MLNVMGKKFFFFNFTQKIGLYLNLCIYHMPLLLFVSHRNQKRFLQRGIELLAEGGDLVYTSTSMNPIENEAVVAAILRMAPG